MSILDRIYAEDTRVAKKLFLYYGIKTPLYSLHEGNEKQRIPEIISLLSEGNRIGLVSDAGTPLLNDPGYPLLKAFINHSISFTILPGSCSPICALVLSGLPLNRFEYHGFVSDNSSELKDHLMYCLSLQHTSVLLLQKRMVTKVIELIKHLEPTRELALVKELTKIHEQVFRGSASALEIMIKNEAINLDGEFILICSPNQVTDKFNPNSDQLLFARSLIKVVSPSKAATLLSKHFGGSKKQWYSLCVTQQW